MGLDQYAIAREELSWYWACADAAVGFRAQNYDPSSSGGVMDEDRIEALAQSMFSWQRRQALRRRSDIEVVRDRITVEHWHILRDVFVPASEFQLGGAVVHYTIKQAFMRGGFPLFMLAVRAPSTRKEFAKAHEMAPEDVGLLEAFRVREWLHREAQKPGERLSRLQTGVEMFVEPAIRAYDEAARVILSEKDWEDEERTSQRRIKLGIL